MATKSIKLKDKDGNTLLPLSCGMTRVTYAQLKAKFEAGELIPGMRYRITDYQCTTTQDNTQSAGHQFDIILTALSETMLSTGAWAAPHDGNLDDDIVTTDDNGNETRTPYFSKCNMKAWQIDYSIENDTSRFAWADAENGKGVIYRMIDEYGNDLPYDFKNIQFKRSYCTLGGTGNYLAIPGVKVYNIEGKANQPLPDQNDENTIFCYTFSCLASATEDGAATPKQADASIGAFVTSNTKKGTTSTRPFENVMEPRFVNKTDSNGNNVPVWYLNNIVFQQLQSTDNAYNVHDNYFGPKCRDLSLKGAQTYGNRFRGFILKSIFDATNSFNDICGDVQNCIFMGSFEQNVSSGDIFQFSSMNTFTSNTIGGGASFSYCKASVLYNNFQGLAQSCSFLGKVWHNVFSGNVGDSTFKQAVTGNTFSGEMSDCEFSGIVQYCKFEGTCKCCTFSGDAENALQYLWQIGEVDCSDDMDAFPTVPTGNAYPQLLTSETVDEETKIVIKTLQ